MSDIPQAVDSDAQKPGALRVAEDLNRTDEARQLDRGAHRNQ